MFVLGVLMSSKVYVSLKFTDHPHLLNIPTLNLDRKTVVVVFLTVVKAEWCLFWRPARPSAMFPFLTNILKSLLIANSPLPFTPMGSRPWYCSSAYPKQKLQMLLKDICKEAGFEGNFTNHSLRATGTNCSFQCWYTGMHHIETYRSQISRCTTHI